MRKTRKFQLSGPYETIADIAIGSLGIFIILSVVTAMLSSAISEGNAELFARIGNENQEYEAGLTHTEKQAEIYKSSNYARNEIQKIEREYEKEKRRIETTRQRLAEEKEHLTKNKAAFEDVTSALDLIEQMGREKADFIVEMDKLNVELQSLIERQTGDGVDRTGRPFLEYYTYSGASRGKSNIFLIGRTSFSIQQFRALLGSFGHTGESSFVIRFRNPNYYRGCDYYEPEWSKEVWRGEGWKPVDVAVKEGYE
jgi:hypothetical protein